MSSTLDDSFNVGQMSATLPFPDSRRQAAAGGVRHAVIRRHQSMYVHPRASADMTATAHVPKHFSDAHEVSRPVVTLQRSKTTAGGLHYRSTSIARLHQHHRTGATMLRHRPSKASAMSGAARMIRHAQPNAAGSAYDVNHNHIVHPQQQQQQPPKRTFSNAEDLCEFQVSL